ncbi:MAG: mannonate dehydratase, partial [Alphaproteobacteria bacterium]|nr:mannonate dehydratase [Alphaproteobacteria bacterium]
DISNDDLRRNLVNFLEMVLPVAEAAGVNLAIHPDDPPRALLGMPRVICTAEDVSTLFQRLPSPANGLTLCVGTFGAHPQNDLPRMATQFGDRIHFAHLRGTRRDRENPLSFVEAEHLDSDIDMISVIRNLRRVESARFESGDLNDIIIRPDHGHLMLDDLHKQTNPGYSAIGRLKGLAEIRGVLKTLAVLE